MWPFKKQVLTIIKNNDASAQVSNNDLQLLSPCIIEKCDVNYQCVERLAKYIDSKSAYNIALTGTYGSGKSSILLTLMENDKQNDYLKISLANFNKSDAGKEEINRQIEYSIMQQLIYHEDCKSIPESRFKRIKHLSKEYVSKIALWVILFFLSILIIFEPSFIQSTSLYQFFKVPQTAKLIIDLFCTGLLTLIVFKLLKSIVQLFGNSKLNKINLKDGELGFSDKETDSILNKHLDEILYYFDVTTYNVVVIEDLDRFETSTIFAKLREINTLINYHKPIKRKITFIYAIKDDVFIDTLRTKFFDIIIPVIPIINRSNSGNMLLQFMREQNISEQDISNSVCKDLGGFIDDMRLLKNIVNEYTQYRSMLNSRLHPDKLLAMMVYKNYYPKDFALLHKCEGILFSIFGNKSTYVSTVINEITASIEALRTQIEGIEAQKQKNINELRSLYLLQYCKNNSRSSYNSMGFKYQQTEFSLESACQDEWFDKLSSGVAIHYTNGYELPKFSTIETQVDPNYSYKQRVELWNQRESGEIVKLKDKIRKLEALKLEKRNEPLKNLLNEESISSAVKDDIYRESNTSNNDEQATDARLLIYLLQQGHLNEYDYYDYISFFFEGSLTAKDNDFRINVITKNQTPFSQPLQQIEALIDELNPLVFKEKYVLNINLLDFLCFHYSENEKYQQLTHLIFDQIKKDNQYELDFFNDYFEKSTGRELFVELFAKYWTGLWEYIQSNIRILKDDNIDTYLYLLLKVVPTDNLKAMNADDSMARLLRTKYDLFSTWNKNIPSSKLKQVITELNITFSSVIFSSGDELLKFVSTENRYDITDANIKVILQLNQKTESIENLSRAHYSSILNSKIAVLIDYVNDNIATYTKNVLSSIDTSVFEDEDAIVEIINSPDVDEKFKLSYVAKQHNKIHDINLIEEAYWKLCLNTLIIYPNWDDVITYFNTVALDDDLFNYLSNETVYKILNKEQIAKYDEKSISTFDALVVTDRFSPDCYKNLIEPFDCEVDETNIALISASKISILIDLDKLALSTYNLTILRDNFTELSVQLIYKNKNSYLSQITTYPLMDVELIDILKSGNLNSTEKLKIIEAITLTTLNSNKELASLICQFIKDNKHSIEYEIFKAIVKHCQNRDLKISIVIQYLLEITPFNNSSTTELLKLLPERFNQIPEKSKKPRIDNNDENIKLSEHLKINRYIKNFITHNDYIRIITF